MPNSSAASFWVPRQRWLLVAAALLMVYVAVLLSNAYQSQEQLRRSAEIRLLDETGEKAAVLSDFLAEQETFALNLASGVEIQNYLTNKALGMSLRYGLGTNLFAIEESFRRRISQAKSLGVSVYERILYLDESGNVVIDTDPAAPRLTVPAPEPGLTLRVIDVERGVVISSAAVDYRGTPGGSVVAVSRLEVLSRFLASASNDLGLRQTIVTNSGRALALPDGLSLSPAAAGFLSRLEPGRISNVTGMPGGPSSAAGVPIELDLGLRTPIAGTALSLVTLLPESVLYGHITSRLFLALASSVPIILVLAALLIFRMRERTQRLEADVVESNRNRDELRDRNDLLTIEVRRREALERDLRESEERYRTYIEHAPVGIYVTDVNGVFVLVNPATSTMVGYEKSDMLGMNIGELFASGVPGEHMVFLNNVRRSGSQEREVRLRRRDGTALVAYLRAIALPGGMILGFCMDVTQRKVAEEQIHNLAFYDPLTTLPNRRLLMDRLRRSMTGRNLEHGALLMLDLYNFKNLNDTLGHDMGDRLLVEVSKRLRDSVRQEDTVSRLGGDEFVVILEKLGSDIGAAALQAEKIAQHVHRALCQPYDLVKGAPAYVSTQSIGVAVFRGGDVTVESLLKQADVALYDAKNAGRNTIRFFSPEMQDAINSTTRMVAALRQALSQDELQLYYQPQVNMQGVVVGAEALLRWVPPDGDLIMPAQFIPLAEESGLIVPIGNWIIEQSFVQLHRWQQNPQTRALTLAINVSSRQFHQPDFVERICAGIDRYGIDPTRIKLELTEGVVLERVDDVIERMKQLRGRGVNFSLDDFGTGYSSLSYLKLLPISQVKIDQAFVRDLTTDPNDATIVRAILAMSLSLGLSVMAEGVETPEQGEFLLAHGCTHFQGYLFGKPVPIEQFDLVRRDPMPFEVGATMRIPDAA